MRQVKNLARFQIPSNLNLFQRAAYINLALTPRRRRARSGDNKLDENRFLPESS